jgi:cobalt-zinc-cadmium efflux system protein
LWAVLLLNLALVAGLIVVGTSARSLGVLAEGVDYLADAAAIAVSLLAVRLSQRPPAPARSLGYPRASTFAALVNGSWLLVLCLLIASGAIERLATGVHTVRGLPVLIASGAAAAAMLVGALVLGGDSGEVDENEGDGLNMRAVLLDTVADAAAAAGVAITGAVILVSGGLYWLDPAVALVVSGLVAFHAVRLLRRVTGVLRSTPPARSRRAGGETSAPKVTTGTDGDGCY